MPREARLRGRDQGGDMQMAVIAAIGLARDNLFRLAISTSQAWLKRTE